MTPNEIITSLKNQGISIEIVDERLKIKAPNGKLTPELLGILKERKEDILAYLNGFEIRRLLPAISAIEDQDHYPLSAAQTRLWILDQFEESRSAYHIFHAYEVKGIDPKLFELAFQKLIMQYEVLRTTFISVEGESRQKVVSGDEGFRFEYKKSESETAFAHEMEKRIRADHGQAFDLGNGSLLRGTLIENKAGHFIFLLTLHHIISDGWSMEVLFEKVMTHYGQLTQNKESSPVTMAIQYRDYAAWQGDILQGTYLEGHRSYWKNTLFPPAPIINLSALPTRPPQKTFNSKAEQLVFDGNISSSLKALASQYKTSLFVVLLSTLKAFLYRYSRQTDIIVGTPSSGRVSESLNDQIGFFVNLLPLRTSIDEQKDFATLLETVKTTVLGALDHQAFPFDQMVEMTEQKRDASRSPLFDVLIQIHEKSDEKDSKNNGVSIEEYDTGIVTNPFDLTFYFVVDIDKITLNLEYNSDIFTSNQAAPLLRYFEFLTQNICKDIHTPLYRYELLPPPEKQKLIHGYNDTAGPFSTDLCVHQLFEAATNENPQGMAVKDMETTLTYTEINEKANRISRLINDKCERKKDGLIGLMAAHNANIPTGIMGILKAGFGYVPINPDFPENRQRYIIEHSQVSLVICDKEYPIFQEMPNTTFLVLSDQLLEEFDSSNPGWKKNPDEIVYVLYTSGSTGNPKGVACIHRSVVNLIEFANSKFEVGIGDKVISISSMSFDLSVYDLMGSLSAGATIIMVPKEDMLSPGVLIGIMKKEEITFWNSVPSTMDFLVKEIEASEPSFKQENLRHVVLGGDWLPVYLPEKIKKYFPEVTVVNSGGPTEITLWSNFYFVDKVDPEWRSIPYGKPYRNIEMYLLDDYLQPVPEGMVGEICTGGVGVSRGYLNDPERTSRTFLQKPEWFGSKGRIFKTGDLGRYMEDGVIEIVGRKDFQTKIRGYRVELGEIESILLQHEAVERAVVVVTKTDSQEKTLAAYIVYYEGVEIPNMKEYLHQFLPEYMVPSFLIPLPVFPYNTNGKVDRKALTEKNIDLSLIEESGPIQDTQNELEAQLKVIWEGVLNEKGIGIHSNFFALGGHSLMATKLISRIHRQTGVAVSIRDFFKEPTIFHLSKLIQVERTITYKPILALPEASFYEASHAQKRLWLASQFDEARIAFNVPGVYVLDGPVEKDTLEQVFDALVQRHESLRTSFLMENGELKQQIHSYFPGMIELQYQDGKDRENGWENMESFIRSAMDEVFDLGAFPLIKITLIQLEEEKTVLFVMMHHIITDGWSGQTLMSEFKALYESFSMGKSNPYKPLAIQYKDFSAWHNDWLGTDLKNKSQNYWLETLKGQIPVLDLPLDHPRPRVKNFDGGRKIFNLEEKETEGLMALSREMGSSLYMTMLAIFKALFYSYSFQTDLVIGVLAAGRVHPDLEGQIGYYINNLPIRTRFEPGMTFRTLLTLVQENASGAYNAQDYPFDLILDDLELKRDPSRSPLFDVMIQMLYFDYGKEENPDKGGLHITGNDILFPQSRYDLEISLMPEDNILRCEMKYNSTIFEEDSIWLLGEKLKFLSGIISDDPSQTIASIKEQVIAFFPKEESDEKIKLLGHQYWFAKCKALDIQTPYTSTESSSNYISFEIDENLLQSSENRNGNNKATDEFLQATAGLAVLMNKYGEKEMLLSGFDFLEGNDPDKLLFFSLGEESFLGLDGLVSEISKQYDEGLTFRKYSRERFLDYLQINPVMSPNQLFRFGISHSALHQINFDLIRKFKLFFLIQNGENGTRTLRIYYSSSDYSGDYVQQLFTHYEKILHFISESLRKFSPTYS